MSTEDEAAKAGAALSRESEGLQKAASEAGKAANHAQGAVGQAQRAGLGKVAEGIAHLAGRMEKLASMLQTVAGHVTAGQQAAGEVTAQTTPEQAVKRFGAVSGAVDTTHQAIGEAVTETREIETGVEQVLRGAQPGPLLGMLRGVRQGAANAAKQGAEAKQHAEAGIRLGEQIARGESGGTGNRLGPAERCPSAPTRQEPTRTQRQMWSHRKVRVVVALTVPRTASM